MEAGDKVARLLAIGAALSAERDIDRLLEMILLAAKELTGADGGTLYLVNDGEQLEARMLHTSSLGFAMGGTTGIPVTLAPLDLGDTQSAAASCARDHVAINLADVYAPSVYDFTGSRRFDAATGYRTRSLLCTPLITQQGEVIGVVQLINAPGGFDGEAAMLARSLASQAAVAIENRRLLDQLAALFEAFIAMINAAIDEKSPYTGGHCARVPELTLMLADAAAETSAGPLAEFAMSEADRYELRIAGLLHDCGKVTTPVHVVDKATKLETIFDRIALIDTRFEVLRRDAEVAELRGQITPAVRAALLAELADEQAFLRGANTGGERMRSEDIARVRSIAGRRWSVDGEDKPFLSDDEVENLTIFAGTLTGAERQIINQHIVTTISMLEALPWPKHLRRVPEFAGGHHERMDGKGYPRGLTRDQMSIPARAMAIADIFEALTAADRPYKPAKPLSESLRILGAFRDNGHIDPDLFDLFIKERVYLRYAARFLPLEQVDREDFDELLSNAEAT